MNHQISIIFLAALLTPLLTATDTPPNIVIILSDDQAWTDYGFMGHPDVRTPHLDKLAERSLLFERGYVAAPLCRPSLASLITGRYVHQHGVAGNDVDGANDRERLDQPVREAFHKLPSFIRQLTESGYLTHLSGKWWEGSHADGGFTHGMMPKPARHGSAQSLAIGREGLEPITTFIDHAVAEQKPFFVWYAPFLPHTPHNPPARLLEKHQTPGRAEDVAKYFAMCEWFDETCGDLLEHLEQKGLASNTVVLYICDNGWVSTSINAEDPAQERWRQYALRSKGSPYENGVRTPIMISWPGKIAPARPPEFAHAIDFFPTVAALAGLQAPADLPGINLLDPDARKARDIVFGETHSIYNMTPGNPDDTLQYLWCVEDEWKLIIRFDGKDTTHFQNVHNWDSESVRLYRIKDDPHEQTNLAAQHPAVVERLKERIFEWHPKARQHLPVAP